MSFTRPAPLAPGDLVAIAAPASPFDPRDFDKGFAWLKERYRIRMLPSIFERTGYLAGDDARRAEELGSLLGDPEVKAVFAARGGYGATRIVDRLPWDAFAARPKWIVGFSDITALHVEATARAIASLHGPNVTGLSRMPEEELAYFRSLLESPETPLRFADLHPIVPGSDRGVLVGGNISLLEAMAGGGRFHLPEGCILALEDTTERPYRLDRMLTSLRLGGYLARASAIIVGEFFDCPPGPDGVTAIDVVVERVRDLGVPVYTGAPFGHGVVNTPFVLGLSVTLRDGQLFSHE